MFSFLIMATKKPFPPENRDERLAFRGTTRICAYGARSLPFYRWAAVPLSRAAPGRTKRVLRDPFQPAKVLSAQKMGRYFPLPRVHKDFYTTTAEKKQAFH